MWNVYRLGGVEVEKVKSALDIALERSRNLAGEAVDSQLFERQQYRAVGESMARSILSSGWEESGVEKQLEQYQGEARELIEKTAALALVRSISLSNYEYILGVIARLRSDADSEKHLEEAWALCNQVNDAYLEEEKAFKQRWDETRRNELAAQGIRGTSIAAFNFRAAPEWRNISQKWDKRLDLIRLKLNEYLSL